MIGENIKDLRKRKKLTQKQLAELTGVTASTITKYELGSLEPNIDMIKKIAEVLKVDVIELYGWDNTQNISKEVNYITHLDEVFKYNGYDLINSLTEDINEQFEYDVNVLIKFLALKYNLTKEGE